VAPNGLELSCPAARATLPPFNGILAGNTSSNFPPASRVSCSELFGGSLPGSVDRSECHEDLKGEPPIELEEVQEEEVGKAA